MPSFFYSGSVANPNSEQRCENCASNGDKNLEGSHILEYIFWWFVGLLLSIPLILFISNLTKVMISEPKRTSLISATDSPLVLSFCS